jgi:hypothetical protein
MPRPRPQSAATASGCRHTLILGTPAHTAGGGRRRLAFGGRINGRRRPVGAYRLTLTAINASGRRSWPHTLRFTIVR